MSEYGAMVESWYTRFAFLTLVKKSESASTLDISPPLPASLLDARKLPFECHLAEAQPAQAKLPIVPAGSPTDLAPVVSPGRELGLTKSLVNHSFSCHSVSLHPISA